MPHLLGTPAALQSLPRRHRRRHDRKAPVDTLRRYVFPAVWMLIFGLIALIATRIKVIDAIRS